MEAVPRRRGRSAADQSRHAAQPDTGDDAGQRAIPRPLQTLRHTPQAGHDGRPHRHWQIFLHYCNNNLK